jgi:predicted dinucleotide-binding enzyme
MNITTIGRGNIGGGLAKLWEQAGHTVTTRGSDGGDASSATPSSSRSRPARSPTPSAR